LHRSPKLAAPTLLVVGEVVRFADPATLSDEFGLPAISAGNSTVPAVLFEDSSSTAFLVNEEPLA
jgi:hypothetical protein